MNNKKYDITISNETGLFYRFALPNILSFVLMSSAGIVDGIFIGKYAGEISLAAVNISYPVFSFIWGLAMMIMVGGAVAAGKYLGEKNIDKACQIFTKSIFAVAFITIIISLLIFLFNEKIIMIIGGSEKTLPISSEYIKLILPFVIFNTLGYGLSIFARVDGFPFTASFALVTGALINIVLDALFIAVFNMGVKGAAYATGISFISGFLIMAVHFAKHKGNLKFSFNFNNMYELFKASLNGLSEFLNEISAGITMALFNVVMMKYAQEEGVAAFTAINYILWVGNMVNYEAADSLNLLISTNDGAGKFNRIKKFLKAGIIFTICNGIFIFLLLSFAGPFLTSLFINNSSSNAFTISIEFMSIIKWAFLLSGINMVFSSYFTAMLRPKESAIIAMLRSLIMPCTMLLLLPLYFGKTGIYSAVPLSELVTFLAAITLFIYTKKFLLKR